MKDRKRTLPGHKPGADYAVGYGKPPPAQRFQPGQSGNPKGRPRGAKNKRPPLNEERLKDIILDEAYRSITVRDGERNVSVPMAQAVVRALAVNAAKGQHRAQRLFAELLSNTERQNKALADEWLQAAIGYKAEWEQELFRRERLGITDLPEPLPHPDQVKIDMNKGIAWIQGPATKEEKAELEKWQERQEMLEEERAALLKSLKKQKNPRIRQLIEEDLERMGRMHALIADLLTKIGY
ncbi:DUF5681 domain-containing protein [Limibacillus sp. MBR-115]|jgi:hypothetical protein|uniref:DUF5681 domain-containing protein n=1 Tax=Limibacillus sp. MBR-115 TaxID=3156465 RepID=UPI0033982270